MRVQGGSSIPEYAQKTLKFTGALSWWRVMPDFGRRVRTACSTWGGIDAHTNLRSQCAFPPVEWLWCVRFLQCTRQPSVYWCSSIVWLLKAGCLLERARPTTGPSSQDLTDTPRFHHHLRCSTLSLRGRCRISQAWVSTITPYPPSALQSADVAPT